MKKVVDFISYEDMQFDWAKDSLLSGSLEKVQSENNTGLIVFDSQNDIEAGTVITLNVNGSQADLEIVGVVSQCPFNNSPGAGKNNLFRRYLSEINGRNGLYYH